MPETPPLSRPSVIYAVVLAAVALALLVRTYALALPAMPERVWMAGVVSVALVAATRYPFPLPSAQRYVYLMMDTVVILAAALLFEPRGPCRSRRSARWWASSPSGCRSRWPSSTRPT